MVINMNVDLFFKQLSDEFVNLISKSDFLDQYPLSILSIDKNINNEVVSKALNSLLYKDLKQYSPLFLSNVLLLLLNRDLRLDNKPKLFRKDVGVLTTNYFEKDVDILHPNSLSFVGFDAKILLRTESNDPKRYKKIIFILDNILDLVSPIYKGFCFSIVTIDDKVIRVYYDLEDYYVLVGTLVEEPIIDMFGHILKPELISDFSIYKKHNDKITVLKEDIFDILKDKLHDLVSKAPFIDDSYSQRFNYVLKQWAKIFKVDYKPFVFDEGDFIQNPIPLKLSKKDIPLIKKNMISYYKQLYYGYDS